MTSNPTQPKGILKKLAKKEPAVDPKELAIQHARILQYQKDLEAEILDSLILLSEYPAVKIPPYDSANPAPSDVADFKKHIRLFQPGDYDDLIIERNVNGLCGYSLCPNPKKDMGPGGEWKITNSGIVNRKELEKWCSQKCARRALYVKVQLSETAAWERAGIPEIEIDLFDEDKSAETEADKTARKLAELSLNDQRQAARDSDALALERGQRGASGDKVQFTLREKDVKPPSAEAETPEKYDDAHLDIEGYKSKFKTESKNPDAQ